MSIWRKLFNLLNERIRVIDNERESVSTDKMYSTLFVSTLASICTEPLSPNLTASGKPLNSRPNLEPAQRRLHRWKQMAAC